MGHGIGHCKDYEEAGEYYCPFKVTWTGEPFDTTRKKIYKLFGIDKLFWEDRLKE